MENGRKTPIFDLFWENSKLNDKNFLKFLSGFKNEETDIERIKYPTCDANLKMPKDKLFKCMCNRHSERKYNDYQINEKELSSLFSCFASVNRT